MAQEQTPQKFNYYTRTILIVIFVLLSVSGYTIWRQVIKKPTKFEEIMMCEECGHIFALNHVADELPPYICEKCQHKTAYKAYICERCSPVYGPFPAKTAHSGSNIICPNCGFQEYVKELLYPPIREPESWIKNKK